MDDDIETRAPAPSAAVEDAASEPVAPEPAPVNIDLLVDEWFDAEIRGSEIGRVTAAWGAALAAAANLKTRLKEAGPFIRMKE